MPPMKGDRNVAKVEVCVASAADAKTALAGGADRVELNAALELGGLTPSLGSLQETRQSISIPIVAMLRPRPGGFCYEPHELAVIIRDARLMLEHGADGLAFGFLTAGGRVDVQYCAELIERVRSIGMPLSEGLVFHRAFDFVDDPGSALEDLIRLGFRRVMTSGGRPTALEGATRIAELIRRAAGRIEVLPAGGIRAANVADLIARTGCKQVHASLREPHADPSLERNPDLSLGMAGDGHFKTSARMLAELMRAAKGE